MSNDWRAMWAELGIDLEKHDQFLAALPELYEKTFINQFNRPQAMQYFDFVISEVHGLRVKELVDHKLKGGKVVASFCVFVPEELILAVDAVSIGLCAGAQFPVATGEKVLPRSICPLIKASIGFKLDSICPYFQVADFVIGETTCDGKKKAWEILNDFIPTYVMELPQRKEKEDYDLWEAEVNRLMQKLETETGKAVDFESLSQAVAKVNNRRKVLRRLYDLRKADPVPISGKDALLITQLAFFDDPERFSAKVSELCDELEERVKEGMGVVPQGTPRILITGSPMPIPNWKIHDIIESCGGVVVCEETCTGTRYFEQLTEEGQTISEQLKQIAMRAMKINCACFTPNNERINDILRLVEEYKIDGVIYYNLQFCHPYSIEYYKIERALQAAEIPVLKIESDYSEEDLPILQNRIQAFLEMVGQ
ncbi:Benzoyl-CoA reductase/2-hydroxyglutaryl-CoA dehydratase subunit, BcrC/BadD/HgdB [Carboxydocella sporoproducens DSM 16521]|uniref:Benzoyl-CoA reductase/2-hydroxyglutaryl-CoA dehydratase subunit, BcrC/BadD/HgdB n=2 Tax=Carboxydocella TaxID=178898 RepID=A0A1T4S672_9FIRM|nr:MULTISPECIES: double-cubane-cluster-containing anaerobic reductase [Carboxydocella]AVX21514.1 Benzoyl-CoA reductase/2-hydroxyglutaryl-CoA dehydratase subunit, BcrC/BadD/HgdB [Carboxydocella thermautotrophica]AVX31994.1 Benzoyl-CoA reductase/2-hydroxyglutaryl-CoA dehydratase subunit, BcrC/BadD/HgdB [Carboxydocella thermautotrophica]SKA23351.1 Benzoyl-CoA reductase/2-hydroxyglutaryl-CoA dehydratase subunit, BcrC/BadD/HgdB [Carboxydocella sporoproducens DSM 16521]